MTSQSGSTGSLRSNGEVLPRCGDDTERSHSNHRHQYDRRFRSSRVASAKASLNEDGGGDNRASSKSRSPVQRSSGSRSRTRERQDSRTRRNKSSVTLYSTFSKSRRHRQHATDKKESKKSCRRDSRRCRSRGSRHRGSRHQYRSRDRSRSSSIVRRDDDGYMVMDKGRVIRQRYSVIDILGEGTFGRVAHCKDLKRNCDTGVAVKVVKDVSRYREAARLEIKVLEKLAREDPKGKHRCISLIDWFNYHGHMCLVFDLMGKSVFDFLKDNNYERYPISHVRQIVYQLCDAVNFLHEFSLTHTDLKPENILFVDSSYTVRTSKRGHSIRELRNPEIRLIDFGSATFEKDHHSTTVATRHYRAPEVILETGWSTPCDVWAIGCILYEIYTGQTLFMTHDNLEHLAMMETVLGRMPSSMIRRSRRRRFFRGDRLDWDWSSSGGRYVRRTLRSLDRCNVNDTKEDYRVLELTQDMLRYDSKKRITLSEALKHPLFQSVHRGSCDSSDDSRSSYSRSRSSSFSD